MYKSKNSKWIILAVSIVLLIGITGISYAYWDTLQAKGTVNIEVGKGTILTIDITENIPDGKFLIPQDALLGENDIAVVTLVYNVKLSKTPQSPPSLIVEASNVLIGGEATYKDLIIINIDKPDTISSGNSVVTITVNLADSNLINEDAYLAINSKTITMDITFTAVA